MITRTISTYVKKIAGQYPVIVITGPRQSGKTTLARFLFPDMPYVSLENIDTLEFAEQDTRAFLAKYEKGAVLDEVQRCPSLFRYLQQVVDEGPKQLRFVLTGSQQFGLRSAITQSLAGRAANCILLPFSYDEWFRRKNVARPSLEQVLFTGLFPPIHDRNLEPSTWYANYVQNYIERDLRQIVSVHELRTFQLFVKMCAARCGQLLNLSGLASDCGVSVNTAKGWISVLEASYIIFLLHPHHRNFGKRLIKSPKLYFYDSGLLSYLVSIQNPEMLSTHSMRGQVFESFIMSEIKKSICNTGAMDTFCFWRDRAGHEVDLIIEEGEKMHAAEIKSGTTISSDFFDGLLKWKDIAGHASASLRLIYGGIESQKRGGIQVVSWEDVDTTFVKYK